MNIAIIFAGGVGERMKTKTLPKQFLNVHGKPIIIHTIEHFENHNSIDAIMISCVSDWIDYLYLLLQKYNIKKVVKVVEGGETGQLSIFNGLKAARGYISDLGKLEEKHVVLIHDGVRPLINSKLISDCIDSVINYGSAITSVTVKETVLMVKDSITNEIDFIPDRSTTRLARAPQCFWLDDIYEAQEKAFQAGKTNYIDSCGLMQAFGKKLHLVEGPMENIKVTTPDDFYSMRALLDAKENEQMYLGEC